MHTLLKEEIWISCDALKNARNKKKIMFQNSNAALYVLCINKMWINVSKKVLSTSFAACVLSQFGLFLIDL